MLQSNTINNFIYQPKTLQKFKFTILIYAQKVLFHVSQPTQV